MSHHQTPTKNSMFVIDQWEALARNIQYAEDYRNWETLSTRLESKLEMGGTLDHIGNRNFNKGVKSVVA